MVGFWRWIQHKGRGSSEGKTGRGQIIGNAGTGMVESLVEREVLPERMTVER